MGETERHNLGVEPAQASELGTQMARNEAAVRLLRNWLDDDSGYDEKVWPEIKQRLEEDRPSFRSRFRD